jgi:hypothetical protein
MPGTWVETVQLLPHRQATVLLRSWIWKRAKHVSESKNHQLWVILQPRTGQERPENTSSNNLNPVLTSLLNSPQLASQKGFPELAPGTSAFSSCFYATHSALTFCSQIAVAKGVGCLSAKNREREK